MTTLVVTNDFPPRIGGIESFVATACSLLDDDVVVYTSGPPGADVTDRHRPYAVVRDGGTLLPTPAVARRAVGLLREHGARSVLFGAAAPLGLLAPRLRAAGAERIVGLTHGHEVWWARLPAARAALRRIGAACDHLTTVSDYTATRIAPALDPTARAALLRLAPPVDTAAFRPAPQPPQGRPQVVAVGRFVRQKGFDVLVRAWARVLRLVPEPVDLVLVGDGPQRAALVALARRLRITDRVRFTGALDQGGVVAELQRSVVFALPVRTRLAGLNPEALGLAALEAAACGLPVLVGRSGGAPETVEDGVSGFALPSDDEPAWAAHLAALLADPEAARAMGRAGRRLVQARFGTGHARDVLRGALGLGEQSRVP